MCYTEIYTMIYVICMFYITHTQNGMFFDPKERSIVIYNNIDGHYVK